MVLSVNDLALTGSDSGESVERRGDPNPSGGYQLEARLPTLQEQALGAFVNDAQTDALRCRVCATSSRRTTHAVTERRIGAACARVCRTEAGPPPSIRLSSLVTDAAPQV